MKVGKLLEIMAKAMSVMEYYRDYTVNEMLDDVYQKCCVTGNAEGMAAEAVSEVRRVEAEPGRLPPAETVGVLSGMKREEQLQWLKANKYLREDLKEIAVYLKLKFPRRAKKDEIRDLVLSAIDMRDRGEAAEPEAEFAGAEVQNKGAKKKEQDVSGRVNAALEVILDMQQEEITAYLGSFYKYEILEIARRLNLPVAASNRKDNIVLLIAKHIGYPELNRRIAARYKR